MACHVSLFPFSAMKLIHRKLKSIFLLPIFTEFQSDAQRESYDNGPKVTSFRWNLGAYKNPNFHISYLRKYCEPRSEIFTQRSSGLLRKWVLFRFWTFVQTKLCPISHNDLIMDSFTRANLYGVPCVTISSFGSKLIHKKLLFVFFWLLFT